MSDYHPVSFYHPVRVYGHRKYRWVVITAGSTRRYFLRRNAQKFCDAVDTCLLNADYRFKERQSNDDH